MTDFTVWQTASLPSTIDHVLDRYHETHRRQLAQALALAEKARAQAADSFPAELIELVHGIDDELGMHMQKEERMLFPMIKNGMGRSAGMPIRMMMLEHEEQETALNQLIALTNEFTAPNGANSDWQQLYADLRTFVDDLHDHIELENNILFPRALNEPV